jgi:hypothetical protein
MSPNANQTVQSQDTNYQTNNNDEKKAANEKRDIFYTTRFTRGVGSNYSFSLIALDKLTNKEHD